MARARNGKLRRTRYQCIYERNGVYVVAMSDGQGGKLWQGGIASLDEAVEVRRELQDRKRQFGGKRKRETIGSFAARWTVDFPRPSESTNIHNREMVKRFAREFGGLRLSEFTGEQASAFAIAHPSDAIRVRTMFQDAVKYRADGIRQNPFAGITIPKSRGRSEITVLTAQELAEMRALAEEVHGREYGPVYSALIGVAAWTGMRPGELFALSWQDIDFEEGVIHVLWARADKTGVIGEPKGKKRRVIALTAPAADALRALERLGAARPIVERGGHEAPLVFATKRGLPYTHRNHHYAWDPVRRAFYAQLPPNRQAVIGPDLDFYELRHFCGTYLADAGASPYDIAQHMGHSDGGRLAMKVYIHVGEAASRARIRGLRYPDDRQSEDAGESASGS